MTFARGVDVSSHQGAIDWVRVAANWQFALARMTIGRSTLDATGQANLKGMLATSILPGAYGVVGTAEPVEDGAHLLVRQIRAAGADPAKVLVMLDAEDFSDGSHPTIGQVDRYAQALHGLTGRWPVAYVPLWWLGSHAYTVSGLGLANCPWAQSRYYDSAYWSDSALAQRKPTLTHGWKQLAWLQYTSSATTPGISGGVDANVFYGSRAELATQLIGIQGGLTMADASDILSAIDDLRAQLTVTGTASVKESTDKLYDHAKTARLTLDGWAKDGVPAKLDVTQLSADQLALIGKALATGLVVEGVQARDGRLLITVAAGS